MNATEIATLLKEHSEWRLPCVLCGRLTHHRDVCQFDDPKGMGLGEPPEGKVRLVIVPLCERHIHGSDFPLETAFAVWEAVRRELQGRVP